MDLSSYFEAMVKDAIIKIKVTIVGIMSCLMSGFFIIQRIELLFLKAML